MKTKHLAITGNMGSGKTTVCRFFEVLDIPVYYSDSRAKLLMSNDIHVQQKIIKLLGNESYSKKGELNRVFIASKIFKDRSLLNKMNKIVHPAVRKDYLEWRENQASVFTLQESALTFEIEADKIMDATIVVVAPEELLIERSMDRDQIKRSTVKERLSKQMPQKEKIKKANFIIYNGMGDLIYPQVLEIYNLYNK